MQNNCYCLTFRTQQVLSQIAFEKEPARFEMLGQKQLFGIYTTGPLG